MAKDPRGRPLLIRSGDQILIPPSADGYLLTFPQGVPKLFAKLFPEDPTRDPWADRSPNDPSFIRLTNREISVA